MSVPAILRSPTDPRWLACALANLDAVLLDHAHCEKKAAAAALSLINLYPEHATLVRRAAKVAQEELRHFYQVHRILAARGLTLRRDPGDPYAQGLLALMRHGSAERLMDRLLVNGLIEARSCERLQLLGDGLGDTDLGAFYRGLATAEAGHYRLFVQLAETYADPAAVQARLAALAEAEAALLTRLPIEPRIH